MNRKITILVFLLLLFSAGSLGNPVPPPPEDNPNLGSQDDQVIDDINDTSVDTRSGDSIDTQTNDQSVSNDNQDLLDKIISLQADVNELTDRLDRLNSRLDNLKSEEKPSPISAMQYYVLLGVSTLGLIALIILSVLIFIKHTKNPCEQSEPTGPKYHTDYIREYIDTNLKKGYSLQMIHASLRKHGYSQKSIGTAFKNRNI